MTDALLLVSLALNAATLLVMLRRPGPPWVRVEVRQDLRQDCHGGDDGGGDDEDDGDWWKRGRPAHEHDDEEEGG